MNESIKQKALAVCAKARAQILEFLLRALAHEAMHVAFARQQVHRVADRRIPAETDIDGPWRRPLRDQRIAVPLTMDVEHRPADAKLDEQGNLTGIDFEALKKDNAYMFTDQPRESAGGDPKGGAGSDGLADFRAAFGLTDESSKE